MKIELDIGSEGEPFIELNSYGDESVEGKTLTRFIEKAIVKGIVLVTGCTEESCSAHAEIRIKNKKDSN